MISPQLPTTLFDFDLKLVAEFPDRPPVTIETLTDLSE